MDPIVIGYPRSGFTLLISVINEVDSLQTPLPHSPAIALLRAFCDTAGREIEHRVHAAIAMREPESNIIYNENFREMVGGPKWLKATESRTACFRKYIGIRGKGDFLLITSHPCEVLDTYHVVHSHVSPSTWASAPQYRERQLFASVRHPAGTVASACFSLNALASEYIQRFISADDDTDELRQRIALHKLSNLHFFEALLPPFKAYMEEFNRCADRYVVMRWEDVILNPAATIRRLGEARGCDVSAEQAAGIWRNLDHVNLTGAHRHNLRVGHGIVGGWQRWLVNRHLELLEDYGLDTLLAPYGYGPLQRLDESRYTPFQQHLAGLIERGEVFQDYGDENLFGFAFNKTNIDISRFSFKRYAWREHTQIERSSCTRDDLVEAASDAAEEACGQINDALSRWLDDAAGLSLPSPPAAVDGLVRALGSVVADSSLRAGAVAAMTTAVVASNGDRSTRTGTGQLSEPVLLQSVGTTNIVAYDGQYYALPQDLGPIDFHVVDVARLPRVQVSASLDEIRSLAGES